jgi:phosphoribosylaminoimidazolecarboxamide formyltransferase/IMP cyclohydrolase
MTHTTIKRALLSASDTTNIAKFAKQLVNLGIEIISTGGTSQALREAGVMHRQVDELTQLPAMLDGRVKTLHPVIHGGILGRRDVHAEEAEKHHIAWIDLVVVNFYPFSKAVTNDMPWHEAVEYIDIGGPTMVRAAAKNFAWVGVVTDPEDYTQVIAELEDVGGLSAPFRQQLAEKAFALTSSYDAMIHRYFLGSTLPSDAIIPQRDAALPQRTAIIPQRTAIIPQRDAVIPRLVRGIHLNNSHPFPDTLNLQLQKKSALRYGENPHQQACAYQFEQTHAGVFSAEQYQGKPLSYNNMLDAEAAWSCVQEFEQPACVIVKHANPCGVAMAETIDIAWQHALQADPVSAFGGVIALNQPCTNAIAEAVATIFMEVILAPAYTANALEILAKKPNLRVLVMPQNKKTEWEYKFITGGVLMQERDNQIVTPDDLRIVTRLKPNASAMDAMMFAWKVVKHIKSNGILIANATATVGIGAGQVSRIDAVDIAVRKAGERARGAVLASDAFFPFRDGIDRLAGIGISAIIQPGGSVRDEEVIAACDELAIAMVFTGKRCFRH